MRVISRLFPKIGMSNRRSFVGGVLLAFALVVIIVTTMVLTAIGDIARNANSLDDDRSRETTNGALKTFAYQLGATLNDYAAWDDAADNSYAAEGMDWMVSNFGDMTVNSDLFDVALVIDANRNVLMAYRDGVPMPAPATAFFDPALWTLADPILHGSFPDKPEATGFVRTQAGIAAVGIALIRKKSGELTVPADQARYLVFARHLTADKIAKLSSTYVIGGLHLTTADDDSRYFVEVEDARGASLGKLVWTSRTPGDISYAQVRPVVLTAIGLVGTFVVALLLIGSIAMRRLTDDEAMARGLAMQDRLSGLLNRTGLYSGLDELVLRARADKSDVLLLYLDLDGFKEINDGYGHATGDQLIRGVSAGLAMLAPAGAVLARLGGDEFAIALCTDDIDAVAVDLGETILRFFDEPFTIGDRVATVGASIGISSSPRGLVSSDELVRRADMAMYSAKENGRGAVVCYDVDMDRDREARNGMELDLRAAIDGGALELAYQPLIDAASRRMIGVEALARWTRVGHGPVSPDIFIPLAETSGLIDSLGLYMLRRACTQAMSWPDLKVAVNVSPGQFRNPAFAEHVGAILAEVGMCPSRVTLEVTEGYFIQNPARARGSIDALKALGVEIALDDFGAGFSSVGYLRQFGFDRMKIDRSLIAMLDDGGRARDMLQATVALARALEIPVTAEGIEREEQAMILHLCGCDELQGYYFGKPMGAEAISQMGGYGPAQALSA